MTRIYFIPLAFFLQCIPVEGFCVPGWIRYQDSCYLFSRLQLTWDEAERHCQIYGAKLAEIESFEENNFLRLHLLDTFPQGTSEGFWLGAKDDKQEGHWMWKMDNEPINLIDWAPGEPNNKNAEEDCLEFWAEQIFQWNDAPCRLKRDFICEENL